MMQRWRGHPNHTTACYLCAALDGQVHPAEEWQARGFAPGCDKLPCGAHCRCTLEAVTGADAVETVWFIPQPDDEKKHQKEQTMPDPTPTEQRARFTASASLNPQGEFEILAITEGEGNGWKFSADVLRASLSLWDGLNSYVDHAGFFDMPSVMKLGGVCYSPSWDDEHKGVKLKLRPAGPLGPTLAEFAREMLAAKASGQPMPDAGFSADLHFTATGRNVQAITRIASLDLVVDPARGGAFLRALNQSQQGGKPMSDPISAAPSAPVAANPSPAQNQAVEALLSAQRLQLESNALQDEIRASQAARVQLCAYMLDAALLASRLPPALQTRVRTQFAGKAFEAPDLTAAIDDARALATDLTAGAVVQGPAGQIHSVFSEQDRLQAATDDLLGAPRDQKTQGLHVARLSGIRELYHMLTGDYDLHGGYHASRVRLATTTDFSGLVKNALNKIVVNQWDAIGRAGYDWWKAIVTVEHFTSLNAITGTLMGTVGTLPTVSEGGEYTELAVGDSPETASFTKYGGYIPLTLELIDRDEGRKLSAYAKELASAGMRKISALVAAVFTDASGVGPTMADTGALFNATAVTTKGGHANLLTAALAADKWELIAQAMYNQPMLIKQDTGYYGTGSKMAIDPRFCLVPRALGKTARDLFLNQWDVTSGVHAENLLKGLVVPLIVPEWTDSNDYAAVADPTIAPAIFVGERFGLIPEVFIAGDETSPAVFSNDEHRIKVRMFTAVWVNDFRPLHKENV